MLNMFKQALANVNGNQAQENHNIKVIKDEKDKKDKKEALNLMAALAEIFKNIANPNGNLQGAIQNCAGLLIGLLVNVFGGIFSRFFGGTPEQVADLAKSATDALGRMSADANKMEQLRKDNLAKAKAQNAANAAAPLVTAQPAASGQFTPLFNANNSALANAPAPNPASAVALPSRRISAP